MAGTLIEVGEGIYRADQVPGMLAARDRRRAGKTAPPHGLYLQWVNYGTSPATEGTDAVADRAGADIVGG
jgi:tRNA U38,U39,U40 pseudouridine synthase TruA